MDIFWAILIIATIVILLFAVFPSIVERPSARPKAMRPTPSHAVPNAASVDKAMLAAHYVPARHSVPEDYPRRVVGECPYSKPPATDLPLPDLPMCVVTKSADMKLV